MRDVRNRSDATSQQVLSNQSENGLLNVKFLHRKTSVHTHVMQSHLLVSRHTTPVYVNGLSAQQQLLHAGMLMREDYTQL